MFLQKKWLTFLLAITCVIILAACSGNDEPTERGDAEESATPLSEALLQEKVWFSMLGTNPKRNTKISRIYHFDKNNVTYYTLTGDEDETNDITFTIEEATEMSDKELVQFGKDYGRETDLGAFTLDVTLDEYGNSAEYINLLSENGTIQDIIKFHHFTHNVTIFETNYAGFEAENIRGKDTDKTDGLLLTRIDNPPAYFSLDNADSKSKLVTIEEGKEIIEQKKQEEEDRLATEEQQAADAKEDLLAEGGFVEEEAEEIYKQSCMACHGYELEGGAGPALDNVGSKLSNEEIYDVIINGQGAMPPGLAEDLEAKEVANWLSTQK